MRTHLVLSLLTLAATLFSLPAAHAFGVGIEPIVGYSIRRESSPDRTVKNLTYGGRLVAGVPLLSAEAEYTRGTSNEIFSDLANAQLKQTIEHFRLGARSDVSTGMFSFFRFRAGAEARRVTNEATLLGVTEKSVEPTKVYPYVGVGVGVALAARVRIIAEVTATILDTKHWKRNEYAPSLSLAFGI